MYNYQSKKGEPDFLEQTEEEKPPTPALSGSGYGYNLSLVNPSTPNLSSRPIISKQN